MNVTDPEFDFGCTKYHLVNLLSLNQHGTDRYFLEWNLCGFFLSGTFYNGIDFGPVLSTIEFIWYLFRYFLQWNLYGTFSGTFYNGIYMAPALSWIIHVNIGTMFTSIPITSIREPRSGNLDPGTSIREPCSWNPNPAPRGERLHCPSGNPIQYCIFYRENPVPRGERLNCPSGNPNKYSIF